jgi:hypothetical protein
MIETRAKQLEELDKYLSSGKIPLRVWSLFKRIIMAVSLHMPVSEIGEEIPHANVELPKGNWTTQNATGFRLNKVDRG